MAGKRKAVRGRPLPSAQEHMQVYLFLVNVRILLHPRPSGFCPSVAVLPAKRVEHIEYFLLDLLRRQRSSAVHASVLPAAALGPIRPQDQYIERPVSEGLPDGLSAINSRLHRCAARETHQRRTVVPVLCCVRERLRVQPNPLGPALATRADSGMRFPSARQIQPLTLIGRLCAAAHGSVGICRVAPQETCASSRTAPEEQRLQRYCSENARAAHPNLYAACTLPSRRTKLLPRPGVAAAVDTADPAEGHEREQLRNPDARGLDEWRGSAPACCRCLRRSALCGR